MTIQQHASFDSSAAELNATSKLVKAWESKNAKNAAKAGGISLMALSLAACGGSSTTTSSSTDTSTDTSTSVTPAAQTFTLTTAVDLESAFTGGAGNDIFIADNTGTDVSSTADTLNGGDGIDTLNIYSDGAAGAMPALTSVEVLNVYDQDAALTLTSTPQSSLNTVNLVRGDGLILTLGSNVATVGLTDITVPATDTTTDDIIVAFEAARTSATLNLNDVNGTAGDLLEDVQVTGAALTTVNVNATGSASSFDGLDLAAATTINLSAGVAFTATSIATTGTASLNLSGAGAVSIGTLDADINTVTSTATGALTAAIGANVDTVLTSGSGNDVITASTTDTIATTAALAVNAGGGEDVLIIGDAADIGSTADGARYTNFETVRFGGFTQDMANLTGSTITGVQITAASSLATNMTAAQASNVTLRADAGTSTFALATATGSSDALTVTMANTTATASADLTGATVTGFETMNVVSSSGSSSDINGLGFAAAGNLTAINLSGAKPISVATANVTSVATIDGSDLTFSPASGAYALTLSGALAAGSTVTGSDYADSLTVSATLGTTYNAGAGADKITAAVATLVADGVNDTVVNGGAGTDNLTISDTAATLTDNHFTNVAAMETITTSTGATSITTGAAFTAAFANDVTITSGTLTDGVSFVLGSGLYSQDVTLSVDGSLLVGDGAGEDVTITTGAGDDSITVTTDATWVGNGGGADGGAIAISAGAGADTITFGYGTLVDQITSQAVSITGGTGADTITKTMGTNGTAATTVTIFNVASGDSTTTAWDTISGFDLVENTGSLLGDMLDFSTGAVSTFSASADFNTILSHNLSAGIVSFDDAGTYSTALVIDASDIADVAGYLAANTATNDVVAFLYDKDADGTNDSTMVYANLATDAFVLLDGVTTAAGLSATATLTTDNYLIIG